MKFFIGLFIVFFIFFSIPATVYGQSLKDSVNKQLQAGGKSAKLTKDGTAKDPRLIVAGVVEIALTLVGMICIALIITAGYWYFTSHGETEKIDKAKHTLSSAVIGLAITLSAYGITTFLAKRIQNAVQVEKPYDIQNNSFPPGGGSKEYDVKNFNLDTWK